MSQKTLTKPATGKINKAFVTLRDMIHSGQIKPGQSLTEARAAALTGFSRGTIRESLFKLEAAGFIGQRGTGCTRVVLEAEDMTMREILEHYELREALEGKAAYSAALHMTDNEIARLHRLAEETDRLNREPHADRQERYEKHTEFHAYLMTHCGNRYIRRIWEQFNLDPIRIRTVEFEHKMNHRFVSANDKNDLTYASVVDLIQRREPHAARSAMEAGIGNASRMCRILLDEELLGFGDAR